MDRLPHHHVASGSYFVGGRQRLVLEAYLGTCVGVALYDRQANVGGLCHLLLPEPIGPAPRAESQKYASTAMPQFLRAMRDAGADDATLSAHIAGGALVGPLDDRDLALDIGGRTSEIVQTRLTDAGIAVAQIETGGFFTCRISLDLQTGECLIQPAGENRLERDARIEVPSPADVDAVIAKLQPIPQVALKIMRLIETEDFDIARLSDEIRKDQVISARTLSLCNSVMFGGRRKIDSLDHALVYLGINSFVKFIVVSCLNQFFDQSEHGYSLCKGGLYHHAVGCAIIAEKLARETDLVKPGLAYTAGLLHDIGKVVLDQYVSRSYPLFYRQLNDRREAFIDAERSILSTDHTEAGATLADLWELPDSLIMAIRHHHHPENAGASRDLTHVVYLADLLMSRFHSGLELERLSTSNLAARLQCLGLQMSDLPRIVDMIPIEVFAQAPELVLAAG